MIYPELCYQIIGVLFDVYNKLGYGYKEEFYQRAVAKAFENSGLKFKEQVYAPVIFQDTNIGKNYFDFLVENKAVVELKRGNYFSKNHIEQLFNYLKVSKLQLGLLVYFNPQKLIFKRIVNISK